MPRIKQAAEDFLARARAIAERSRRKHLGDETAVDFPTWLRRVTPSFRWDWHYIRAIIAALDRVTSGETKRLMIFIPPQHGKSELVLRYIVWRLENDPALRCILASYHQKYVNKLSRKMLRIARTRLEFAEDRKAVEEWELAQGGGVRAVGVGVGVTGNPADFILIDDPIKGRAEAESETIRDRTWDWYKDDLYTRLQPNAPIILIQTRWHEDDLSGRLLLNMEQGGEEWEVLRLPALAEPDDPLGRAPGEALCPDRFDEVKLEKIRRQDGEYSFSALYQQRPQPAGGGLFKTEWLRDIADKPPDELQWACYWDLAASTRKSADYTAGAVVALAPDGTLWIREITRFRAEWPDARKIIMDKMKAAPNVVHGIEESLHGLAAVQELMREPSVANVAFYGIRVEKDKKTRALPWAVRAETGKLKLVRGPWIRDFVRECESFPGGAHDDMIDAVSGGLQMIANGWAFPVAHGPTLDQILARGGCR